MGVVYPLVIPPLHTLVGSVQTVVCQATPVPTALPVLIVVLGKDVELVGVIVCKSAPVRRIVQLVTLVKMGTVILTIFRKGLHICSPFGLGVWIYDTDNPSIAD